MASREPTASDPVAEPPVRDPNDARLDDANVGGRVVRGGALRIGSMAATNVLVAIGAIVLLRYLGVSEFGRYGTVMAIVAIVQGVTDAGLGITGMREMSLVHGEERRRMLAHILGLRIILTAVGVVAAVVFAVLAGYDTQLVQGTALAGVAIFLVSVQGAMVLPLSVELRNGTLALNEVLRQLLLVVGWIALVVLGSGLLGFFAVQIVSGVILIAVTPLLLGRHHLVRPRWESAQLRALTAVGLPIALAGFIAVIYYRVLTIMASLLTDDYQTGLFVTASRVFEMAYAVPVLLVTVILPVMTVAARDDRARLRFVTQRMTEAMTLAGVAVGLLVAGAAEPIVVLLGQAQYEPAAPVLQILAIALVSLFVGSSWSPVLIATGNQRYLAIASGIGLLVVVVLGLVLLPTLDAEGAAIAFAAADWVLLAVTFVFLRRTGHGAHLDFRFVLRLLPLTAVAAAIVFVPWASEAVTTAVGVVAFAAGTLVLRLVPDEVLDVIVAHVPGLRRA